MALSQDAPQSRSKQKLTHFIKHRCNPLFTLSGTEVIKSVPKRFERNFIFDVLCDLMTEVLICQKRWQPEQ